MSITSEHTISKIATFTSILTLFAFLIFKLYNINVPFFWDESWVYGPALAAMSETMPSLLPGVIDIDLSRGHPLLFHFLGGIWGNIFGNSVASLHVFALSISLLLVGTVYFISKSLINRTFASIAVILLICQGVFLSQSAMVLPEVIVALFSLVSIYLFSKGKYLLSIIAAALCLLSKESGAVLMPALGLSFLVHHLLLGTFSWKKAFQFLGFLIAACIPYVLFLIIQKARFGWAFYPNHMDLQASSIKAFIGTLKAAFNYAFLRQGRFSLVLLAFIAVFLSLKNNSRLRKGFLIIPFNFKYKKENLFFLTSLIYTCVYLPFTAINFFSARYVLVLIPIGIIGLLKIISIQISIQNSKITYVGLLGVFILCTIKAIDYYPPSDTNLSFIDNGNAQLELFQHLEKNNLYNETIMATFLIREALVKEHAGYRSTEPKFTNLPYYPNDNDSFYNIKSSFEGEAINDDHKNGRTKAEVARFKRGEIEFILEKYTSK